MIKGLDKNDFEPWEQKHCLAAAVSSAVVGLGTGLSSGLGPSDAGFNLFAVSVK